MSVGLLDRQRKTLQAYAAAFDVAIYSADTKDYSAALGVQHRPAPWLPGGFGLRHFVYYIWLVLQAARMRGVLKVVGSNIPTLPLVRWIARRPMAVTLQYDYAGLAGQTEGQGTPRAGLARLMQWLALWRADQVFVTTPTLERLAQQAYHKPTRLMPNWVDLDQISALPARPRSPSVILYAGRLHRIKGLDVLLEGVRQDPGPAPAGAAGHLRFGRRAQPAGGARGPDAGRAGGICRTAVELGNFGADAVGGHFCAADRHHGRPPESFD